MTTLIFPARPGSANAVAQCRFHLARCLQRAEHVDAANGRSREAGRNVQINDRKPENLDVTHLAGRPYRFQLRTAVVAQAKIKLSARNRLLDRFGLPIKLIGNGRADEVGAVGVEPFLHKEVDLPEVDEAQIDRVFSLSGGFGRSSETLVMSHLLPSIGMAHGWIQFRFKSAVGYMPICLVLPAT